MQEDFVEDVPRQQSYLEFLVNGLGIYVLLLPFAALVSFVLVLVLVIRGKGGWAAAAIVLIVPVPLLLGFLGVIEGLMAMYQVIAASGSDPKPSAVAEGIAQSLVTAWVGMLLSIPTFLLAVVGSFVRSLSGDTATAAVETAIPATIVESKR